MSTAKNLGIMQKSAQRKPSNARSNPRMLVCTSVEEVLTNTRMWRCKLVQDVLKQLSAQTSSIKQGEQADNEYG